MPFLSDLDGKLISDYPAIWRLDSPLIYDSKIANMVITVPSGFETDLASVPRLPFAYWLTGGSSNKPAVVHDYLYVTCLVDKAMADRVFLEAMEEIGVSRWRRQAMYRAVKMFGRGEFKKPKGA